MSRDQGLVLEVAFEGLARSPPAQIPASPMRFPRITGCAGTSRRDEPIDWNAGAEC